MTKLNLTPEQKRERKRRNERRWRKRHRIEYNEYQSARWRGKHHDWLFRAFAKAGVPAWEIEQRRKLLARKTL